LKSVSFLVAPEGNARGQDFFVCYKERIGPSWLVVTVLVNFLQAWQDSRWQNVPRPFPQARSRLQLRAVQRSSRRQNEDRSARARFYHATACGDGSPEWRPRARQPGRD